MRCGHPSFRGAETSAAEVGSEPCRRRSHWVEHPDKSEPGPTQPPRWSEPVEPSWIIRGAFLTDAPIGRPSPSRTGAEAPWLCVRYRAFRWGARIGSVYAVGKVSCRTRSAVGSGAATGRIATARVAGVRDGRLRQVLYLRRWRRPVRSRPATACARSPHTTLWCREPHVNRVCVNICVNIVEREVTMAQLPLHVVVGTAHQELLDSGGWRSRELRFIIDANRQNRTDVLLTGR